MKRRSGETNKKDFILFLLSAFLRLISNGTPSVVSICFEDMLFMKKEATIT